MLQERKITMINLSLIIVSIKPGWKIVFLGASIPYGINLLNFLFYTCLHLDAHHFPIFIFMANDASPRYFFLSDSVSTKIIFSFLDLGCNKEKKFS